MPCHLIKVSAVEHAFFHTYCCLSDNSSLHLRLVLAPRLLGINGIKNALEQTAELLSV